MKAAVVVYWSLITAQVNWNKAKICVWEIWIKFHCLALHGVVDYYIFLDSCVYEGNETSNLENI